jgi:protein NRD1
MSSCVAELDGILQSMLALKPPGVSGSKITSITALCNANVQVCSGSQSAFHVQVVLTALILLQSESVLIQKIYTHFKKTPGTHKLGVLYVVDSVTRQWVDQARKAGQPAGGAAQDGTFAAGVTRVTELLPVLMTDIINTAPEDQKVRLIDTSLKGSSSSAKKMMP